MPTLLDLAYAFTLLGVASIAEHFIFWPRFREASAAGVPGARIRGYRRGIVWQWAFALAVLAIWQHYARPAASLRLTAPSGWRAVAGIAAVAVMLALAAYQLWSVARLSPARRAEIHPRLGNVSFLLPHTEAEHRWFLALSLTAGICEELVYRGYLVWLFSSWVGLSGAYVAVIALFGIGHAYQGRKGATRATLAGMVLTALVALTGWLVPAMIVHALVDASSGTAGYWLVRDLDDGQRPLQEAQPVTG